MVCRPPAGAGERDGGEGHGGFPHLQAVSDQVGRQPCMCVCVCVNQTKVQVNRVRSFQPKLSRAFFVFFVVVTGHSCGGSQR